MENFELNHSGVKGMKWGVRRYQNKDGSLTSAGRKRYGASKEEAMKARAKAAKKAEKVKAKEAKQEEKASKKLMKKSVKDMTDAELSKAISRAKLEQEYTRMHPEPVSRGKKIAQTMMKDVIAPAAVNAGKKYLDNLLGNYVDDMFKDPNSLSSLKSKAEKLETKQKIDRLMDKSYQQLKKEAEVSDMKKKVEGKGLNKYSVKELLDEVEKRS